MIVAFSTSSRVASTALISREGQVLWSAREEAPMAASGACLRQLAIGLGVANKTLRDATLFVADLGPGSFTGVRVGVTLAKSLAFAASVKTAGADAFDLIDRHGPVVLPSKRGEWFVRIPGSEPHRSEELPSGRFSGFGPGVSSQIFPDAAGFAGLVGMLTPLDPEQLIPRYLIEPSISIPKKPYGAEIGK